MYIDDDLSATLITALANQADVERSRGDLHAEACSKKNDEIEDLKAECVGLRKEIEVLSQKRYQEENSFPSNELIDFFRKMSDWKNNKEFSGKISAIKAMRILFPRCGLKEAKDLCEFLESNYNVYYYDSTFPPFDPPDQG